MRYQVELTDTFGDEANYAWVTRAEIEPKTHSRRSIMRAAKAAVGITGSRGQVSDYGDSWDFRPSGVCMVLFVYPLE